ncbi:unnamed protein product [Closterium sp. Naga37s-1]|nr:unnamed protein product [Closterium sp. Naga37s-1]
MQLSETEWRIAAAIRLGLPLPHLSSSHTCTCNSPFTDASIPSHVLRCPSNNEPTKVHDAIKREVHRIALELGFSVQMEDQHLLPGHRTDITCRDVSSGTTWALDVSVADPQNGFPHSNAATVIRSAAATRESEKTTHYASVPRDPPDVELFPFVIETFGCFGTSFNDFLRQCSRKGASQLRDLSGATDSLPQLFETNFYKPMFLHPPFPFPSLPPFLSSLTPVPPLLASLTYSLSLPTLLSLPFPTLRSIPFLSLLSLALFSLHSLLTLTTLLSLTLTTLLSLALHSHLTLISL